MALPTVVGYIVFFFALLTLWFVVDRAAASAGDRQPFAEDAD